MCLHHLRILEYTHLLMMIMLMHRHALDTDAIHIYAAVMMSHILWLTEWVESHHILGLF